MFDFIQPFLIDKTSLSGKFARLSQAVDTIVSRHEYPESIAKLLGELLAVTALLGSRLKSQGILTLQLKSEGIVQTMVADCTSDGEVRGYVAYETDKLKEMFPEKSRKKATYKNLLGKGYLAITLDQGPSTERYQGIVELKGTSFEQLIRSYFHTSEQQDVVMKTSVRRYGAENKWSAAGFMLQKIPIEGGNNVLRMDGVTKSKQNDDWKRFKLYAKTISEEEFHNPREDAQKLLYNLFHEDGVWLYDPKPVIEKCRCDRGRMEKIINSFSEEEREDMTVDGKISVTCQFCNTTEVFS